MNLHVMNIQIVNKSNNPLPQYETIGASGMDVRADLRWLNYERIQKLSFNCNVFQPDKEEIGIEINPGGRCLIPTGLFAAIPLGYEIQVRPRSGLALKKGITVLNSPGSLDSDYRGEIGIILINNSEETFTVFHADKIAQLVFCPVEKAEWELVEELDTTERGEGGFGHTGIK